MQVRYPGRTSACRRLGAHAAHVRIARQIDGARGRAVRRGGRGLRVPRGAADRGRAAGDAPALRQAAPGPIRRAAASVGDAERGVAARGRVVADGIEAQLVGIVAHVVVRLAVGLER